MNQVKQISPIMKDGREADCFVEGWQNAAGRYGNTEPKHYTRFLRSLQITGAEYGVSTNSVFRIRLKQQHQ